MNRRGLLAKIRGAAAALLVLRVAQGAPVAPRDTCPVCGADQTGKAWYAGPQDAEGHSPAVCWGCRAETGSPWPFDTPFAAAAKEAAERGKPVRSVRVYQSDFGDVELTKPWGDYHSLEAAEERLLKAVESAFTHGSDLT